jgi:hypothetical protein
MVNELKVGGYPIYRGGVLHLWVRAVDGDDANHGLDANHPLETMQAAYDRIPYLNPTTVIHVGPHTGDGYEHGSLGPLAMLNHVIVIGDGGGDPLSDGFTQLLAPTAAVAGSDKTKIVTAGGMTVDAYQRKSVLVLTGAAAGDRRTINSNSATEIQPCYDFSAAVAAGDTFRVVEPAIRFKYTKITDDDQGVARPMVVGCGTHSHSSESSAGQGRVWLVNLQFNSAVRINMLVLKNSGVVFLGVDLYSSYSWPIPVLDCESSTINTGYETKSHVTVTRAIYPLVPSVVSLLGVPNVRSWAGWGLTAVLTGSVYVAYGSLSGWIVAPLFLATLNGRANIDGGRIDPNGLHAFQGGKVEVVPIMGRPLKIKGTGWAIGAYEGGQIDLYVQTPGEIQAEATIGDGIMSLGVGSIVRIHYYPVTGSAARYGMTVQKGGEIYYGYITDPPAITGAVGDIDWNNGADLKTNAQLVAGEVFQSKYGRVLRY